MLRFPPFLLSTKLLSHQRPFLQALSPPKVGLNMSAALVIQPSVHFSTMMGHFPSTPTPVFENHTFFQLGGARFLAVPEMEACTTL